MMKRQINAFLMGKGLLSDYQSGFRTRYECFDEKLLSPMVLVNFYKTFDSVNHLLLCSKLTGQFGLKLVRSH
jgi:hypothetical protein